VLISLNFSFSFCFPVSFGSVVWYLSWHGVGSEL
jgi:hypothetical protein